MTDPTPTQPPYADPTGGTVPSIPNQPAGGLRPPPYGPLPTSGDAKPKWYRRKWVQLVAVGTIGLGVGGIGASSDADDARKEAATAIEQRDGALAAKARAEEAQRKADSEATHAKSDAEAALKDERAKLATDQAAADKEARAKAAALDAREAKVSGLESEAKANEFEGEGLYLVGSDIKPGVYKAAASDDCYFARLSSTDTSDIIDNGNTSGPVVITIKASDKALEVHRCGTFHKVG